MQRAEEAGTEAANRPCGSLDTVREPRGIPLELPGRELGEGARGDRGVAAERRL